MKNLLVTGGCGFIGSNFIRYLLLDPSFAKASEGAGAGFQGRIINVDKLTYAGNPESLADVEQKFPGRPERTPASARAGGPRYVFERADICDREAMAKILDRYEVDAIAHFAAESHVDRSIVRPDDFINTNIHGTYTLLQLARERMGKIKLFHHVSTDEVFGSLGATGYFTEETPYSPNSPYSASKAASDHLVRAYHETYKLPVTISNCSNNYGPYQFPEKLISLMILNAHEGKPLPVYGDGKNVRDWLYVRDHCVAIWRIMNSGRLGATFNVGGRNEMANIDVVHIICDVLDETTGKLPGKASRRELITYVKDRPGHDRRYAIDCSKIEKELGWRPEESFETGIRKTIRWYLDNLEWVNHVRSGDYQKWITEHYG